jgi:hypothetical protein
MPRERGRSAAEGDPWSPAAENRCKPDLHRFFCLDRGPSSSPALACHRNGTFDGTRLNPREEVQLSLAIHTTPAGW